MKKRIQALRAKMSEHNVQAYLIPSSDPHQSEYVPQCWQRRPWISGFTGSMGDVLVTLKDAGLWADGRYFLQAADRR
jgi:Xaa-Pro aminopeptidase